MTAPLYSLMSVPIFALRLCGLWETQKQPVKYVTDLATWLSGVSAVAIVTLGVTHVERFASHALDTTQFSCHIDHTPRVRVLAAVV